MPKEAIIRDKLAECLEILEPGLSLRKIEHYLPNRDGTSGRVDLLAKDRYGLWVIIELKRSDSTARQAFHELLKYSRLLQDEHSIPLAMIRYMLVSTHWDELRAPFRQFCVETLCPIDGYRLTVDEDGTPRNAEKILLEPGVTRLRMCPMFRVDAFPDTKRRTAFKKSITASLVQMGVENYCLMDLRYGENPDILPFPYACYLALGRISDAQRKGIRHSGMLPEKDLADYTYPEWDVEEDIIAFPYVSDAPHEVDMNSCILWGRLMSEGWELEEMKRNGPIFDEAIISDKELIDEMAGHRGNHPDTFSCLSAPRLKGSWRDSLSELSHFLGSDANHKDVVLQYLRFIDDEFKNAEDVFVHIYDPGDLISSIAMSILYGVQAYAPRIIVSAEVVPGMERRILSGELCWDGQSCPSSPAKAIEAFGVFPGRASIGWEFARTTGETRMYQNNLLALHGLQFRFVERVLTSERKPGFPSSDEVFLRNDQLERRPVKLIGYVGFIRRNWDYCCDLIEEYFVGRASIDPLASHELRLHRAEDGTLRTWSSKETACDLCGRDFKGILFDAKIPGRKGMWAAMCRHCFTFNRCSIGIGDGQRYDIHDGQWVLTAGAQSDGDDDDE